MSIKRIGDGRYFVRVRTRQPDGSITSKAAYVAGTRADAQRAEAKLRTTTDRKEQKEESYTFAQAMQDYKDRARGDTSKVESILNRLALDLGVATEATMQERFDRYMAILETEKSEKTGERYSAATLNRHLQYASAAVGQAVRFGYWKTNPLKVFSRRKEVARDRVLDREEKTKLLKIIEANYPHILPAVQFAMVVPIRKGELVAMARKDVDQVNHRVKIRNGTTKNGAGVWVPIPSELRRHFASIPFDSPTAFFRTEGDRHLPLGDFSTAWEKSLALAGITDFRFHDLRHHAATAMVNAGVPERVVRAIANWKTDMLRRYYSFDSVEACAEIAALWEGRKQVATEVATRRVV